MTTDEPPQHWSTPLLSVEIQTQFVVGGRVGFVIQCLALVLHCNDHVRSLVLNEKL